MSLIRNRKKTLVLIAFVFPALLFYSVFVLAPSIGGVVQLNGLERFESYL